MARLPELKPLSLEDTVAAAERVLQHPTCNVQRVSMDETLSLALVARQYAALGRLAAPHVLALGDAGADLARHLRDAGFLPPENPETNHG